MSESQANGRTEAERFNLAESMLGEGKPWTLVADPPLGLTYLLRSKQVAWKMKRPNGTVKWMPWCAGRRRPGVEETDSELEQETQSNELIPPHEDAGTAGDCADPTSNPNVYVAAARAIVEADYVLVCAGAGFSKDSGLPVYDEIAEPYKRLGFDYSDLCRPKLMNSDSSIFYGFWGSCYNLYSETMPHDGYVLLFNWLTGKNYYIYTSNVDGHFLQDNLFSPSRVHEIHGCLNRWICEADATADEDGVDRCSLVSAPSSFRFPIGRNIVRDIAREMVTISKRSERYSERDGNHQ
jgi:hypothetical protein